MAHRFTTTRETFIPRGATRISDKGSDAVAFVYTASMGRPAAMVFRGRAAKPIWHHVFATENAREKAVIDFFQRCRRRAADTAERRAAINKPHGLEVGHVLVASWGYEQTNIDFYQVTAIVGRCMVEVRKIAQSDASTGREPWATGKAMPALDAFTGSTLRRRVNGASRSIRIDDVRTAFVWDGRPKAWTAYA
ncbi:hypothetical protein P7D22_08710 [Lichenihabitans sp. Uapishka_5]|uniref:hypothetical protein n=1 Tax=Lichenihabitans sp. Uapishka_5 TaxID=3037302 RepID=UPI0029E8195E|nr:hypothetical protein [Lichenihabitans sp. Uapishka_5]MDX7951257.1 hypothetical protein [Lichenihabitans sp. Uapishka_5]